MQSDTKKIVQFVKSWIISTLAVLVAVKVVLGVIGQGVFQGFDGHNGVL